MNISKLVVIVINLFIIFIPVRAANSSDQVPIPIGGNIIFVTNSTGGDSGGGTGGDSGGGTGGDSGGGTGGDSGGGTGGDSGGGTGGDSGGGTGGSGNRDTEVYNLIGQDILIVTEMNKPFTYTLSVDGKLSATTFSIAQGPSGMTINSSGVLTWTPTQSSYTTAVIRVVKSYGKRVDYIVNVAPFLGC